MIRQPIAWLLVGAALALATPASISGQSGEPATVPAEVAPLSNSLRWTTGSEVDTFGFDVYRATEKKGPFDRITEKPILAAGMSDVPSRYSFVDDTIQPGQSYWYYVERISMDGERWAFTPLIFGAAKRPEPANPPGSGTPEEGPGGADNPDGGRKQGLHESGPDSRVDREPPPS